MNFFEHQVNARRASARLVFLFVLAVIGIVAAVDLAAWLVAPSWRMLAFTTGVTVATILLGSLYRIASLGGGGESVAQQMGGTLVPADTSDLSLRRLRNVVEEIAIASGVPVPKLYVLEEEAGINAFAAGFSPSDAVVAVTRGALDRLNRDELQGVIAHEFSHVLNGDMRLNVRLIGVLFGILMIGLIGRKVLQYGRFGGGRNKNGGAILIAALVAMVVGYIGLFFGRMIKAGVSRSRERLADASAVQFTRQTAGLAGALKKIAGVEEGSRLNQRGDAEEVSHMLFGDGIGFSGLFATHPPLLERIRALEPGFRGEQLERLKAEWLASPPDGMREDMALGLAEGAGGPLPGARQQVRVSPPQVAAQVATPASDDYRRADAIFGSLPDALRDLARDREAVMPLLLALLLAEDEDMLDRQRQDIAARLGEAVADHAVRIHQQLVADLHPMLRLPLAALAFPVLRLRPRPQLDAFLDTVQAVANADGEISLFEYCLAQLLTVQVRESLDPARYARFGRRKPGNVREEFATLLAVVARYGNEDEASARRAYLAGLQRVLPRDHLPYAPPATGVQALDAVWEPLDALDPLAKQAMVEAVTDAISSDGRISVAEAELLRTICGVLHCPLPPMLEQG
ncbi:M48 family metallopeptidase [Thermomonas brevis]|uniref:M48 family metallopeptidase n=1 Tax=Thermomonas brevis TaxID=215691 RepID=A0A7G9QW55_9GAMM|nr:M48 family metallopeptidase [Thermomonas brevis]QNN47580.1 M48 family metallopeptidase [Thermomonas brevis]